MRIISQDGLLTYDWDDVERLVAYNNSEAVGYAMLGHRDKWVIVALTEGETSLMGEYSLKSQMDDVIEMWRKALRDGAPGNVFQFPKEEEIPFNLAVPRDETTLCLVDGMMLSGGETDG